MGFRGGRKNVRGDRGGGGRERERVVVGEVAAADVCFLCTWAWFWRTYIFI